jgi:anti-sigma regulatory factor (Ser/Thr protein kinase)
VPPEMTRIVMHTEQQLSRELLALGRFVTMQVCRLDSVGLTLDYVDCGHTRIVHHNRRDNTVWTFDGSNMPIGFVERQDFVSRRIPLGSGDILFFYSDGLTETRNGEGDLFGVERVMHYLLAHSDASPEEILGKLLSLVFDFSAEAIRDDVTGIIVRTDGSPADASRDSWPLVKGSLAVDEEITTRARAFLKTHLQMLRIAEADRRLLLLATHEAVANIWSYTFGSRSDHRNHVEFTLERRSEWMYISISYQGEPFPVDRSPTDAPMEDRIVDLKERGYGLEIIRTVMDSVVLCEGLHGRLRLVMARKCTDGSAGADDTDTSNGTDASALEGTDPVG